MEELLSVKNLSVGIRRGGKLLSSVENVSFNIKSGEILGIVGESGSGKTLTALSIPGLLGNMNFPFQNKEISGGSIHYCDGAVTKDLLKSTEKELQAIRGKEISMVFQEPFSSLNPLLKIGDQITEVLELHGQKDKALAKSHAKVLLEKLKLSGLPGSSEPDAFFNSYPHRLSGGMCQRVMIAMAIICGPKLLIADEPTTALDRNTQNQILDFLKDINHETGTSILLISHDLEVIKNYCTRVLVMYSGRILEEGSTGEVFSHPAHEYTRGLLNSIPNKAKKGKDLEAIPGKIPSLEEGRPQGCPFHPRCGKAGPLCRKEFPAARSVSATHSAHCVLGDGE